MHRVDDSLSQSTISDLPNGGLLVCFEEAQVGNLDLSVLTAMLGEYLSADSIESNSPSANCFS
jgi:hypothetical protein